jgi:DNA polymerase-3 subunit gamma/tau
MDNYIVSARKYRPDNFESVVGQDSITQTLKNSIKSSQLAQAYLFCGPRGVGKTTCARIFAKTINCTNLTDNHEACNECESCVAFNKLRSLNIHELDAASNNSVEDIRNLIDQVRIPPQIGYYSVYIIDEVHMLSSSAFNAFLKTLEEPPKHVVFILATTEKHKILPTILSRCQIFDFNRIGVEDIRKRLEFVAQKENISAEHDALHIIAQKADGAMRDALSIFDQIVSFSGKNITYENTIKNLNVLDYDVYFNITDSFLTGNYPNALLIFDDVLRKGFEASYFISGLASHFRDLLICKEPGTINLLEVGNKIKTKYLEHAQKCSVSFLFKAIETANQADLNYKTSHNKRLLIELALLNICNIENNALSQNTDVQTPIEKPVKIETSIKKEEELNKEVIAEIPQTEVKSEIQQIPQEVKEIIPQEETIKVPIAKEPEDNTYKTTNPEKSSSIKSDISGISIKNITKSSDKSIEINETGEPILSYNHLGTEEYSDEKLKYVWTKYAESLRENPRLYSFLMAHAPTKESENNYIVTVESQMVKAKLDSDLHETLKFLKTELNNRDFSLSYQIGETKQNKKFKSEQEKLDDMIKENPEIKKLKDQLNLDFE